MSTCDSLGKSTLVPDLVQVAPQHPRKFLVASKNSNGVLGISLPSSSTEGTLS